MASQDRETGRNLEMPLGAANEIEPEIGSVSVLNACLEKHA
jgi:hypothetical protein